LAGGFGKRLRPYTDSIPKSLIQVAGRPIIEWQLEWLKSHGIDEFIVCAGYLREKVMQEIGSGSKLGVKVGYAVEDEPLGTGGALRNAIHLLSGQENFIVVNGDVLTDLDPSRLLVSLREGAIGCVAVTPLPSPFGIVRFDTLSNQVTQFEEKPKLREYWINAGVYAFAPQVSGYLPSRGDIEKTTFPDLARAGKLRAILYEEIRWISIDSHKDLEEGATIVNKQPP